MNAPALAAALLGLTACAMTTSDPPGTMPGEALYMVSAEATKVGRATCRLKRFVKGWVIDCRRHMVLKLR